VPPDHQLLPRQEREILRRLLIRHEGLRLKPYLDPMGKLTIGVGRNLTDVGISYGEAMLMLDNDMDRALRVLLSIFTETEVASMPRAVRLALLDMAFNLGYRLRSFVRMIEAVREGQWNRAAAEALDSRWARQVGHRAEEIARMLSAWKLPV